MNLPEQVQRIYEEVDSKELGLNEQQKLQYIHVYLTKDPRFTEQALNMVRKGICARSRGK